METVDKTLTCGKEGSEIVDFLHGLIEDIKAGKDVADIVAENIAPLMTAVQGYENMADEAKHESASSTVGYMVAKLGGLFYPPNK